jgi:hypothetical protein
MSEKYGLLLVRVVAFQAGRPSERKRGKKETVSLTVRVTRGQWERLHHLAIAEGVSLHDVTTY